MRLGRFEGDGMAYRMRALIGVVAAACASAASAEDASPSDGDVRALNAAAFAAERVDPLFPRVATIDLFAAPTRDADWLTGLRLDDGRLTEWRTGETALSETDRLRLSVGREVRGLNGAPLRFDTTGRRGQEQSFDVAYLRDWPSAIRLEGNGYTLDVTPTAGFSLGSEGSGAEAGATVRFGQDVRNRLQGLVKDGESFGERPRWYLFAAASGRAFGYNLLQSGDGWRRSGMSLDKGSYIGDAQAGVAWRRGDMQASFGYVHREVKAYDYEKNDGFVAFQLSIKPEW
jgi:hypothetical protein